MLKSAKGAFRPVFASTPTNESGYSNPWMTRRIRPVGASVELKIPGYEVLGRIHDGAMGTVWKARQISVDRIVAIKVLGATWASDADHFERFCRESLIGLPFSSHVSPRLTMPSDSPVQFPEVSPFASAAKYHNRASFG